MHLLAIAGLFASAAFAQNIATPVFVLKDGDATAAGYSGTEKDIYVDGGSLQSVGWITFQTQGIDVTKIASAKLLLYVKTLTGPGTLQVQRLTADITAPENNVRLTSIPIDAAVAATQTLGTADVEKVIGIDLTAAVKSGTFKGVALTSDDGLAVMFDSKEGYLAPVILLTNNVNDLTVKWLSGSGVPTAGLGKDGDCYLNTSSGDVYSKVSGAWALVTNIVGPQGHKGDKGEQGSAGAAGPQGPIGLTGAPGSQGPTGLTGAMGPQGSVGLTGATGSQGPTGLPGATGPQGSVGLTGAPGPQGPTGSTGATGPQGSIGLTGAPGPQGSIGAAGAPGAQGSIGLTGAPGPQGSTGLPGATGATGSFPAGTAPSDMQYWNGTTWAMVPVGQPGQFLQVASSNIPSWSGATFPAITTTALSSIVQTTATSGGTITNDGGATVTARGVCWNTSVNPTTAHSKTTDGAGTGAFTSSLTGLTTRTTYHARAYAINSAGTVYGNQVDFTTN